MSNEVAKGVGAFCESAEMLHCATFIARIRLIEGQGRKSAGMLESAKAEMRASLMLYLEAEPSTDLIDILFMALLEAVSANMNKLAQAEITTTPALQAEIVKMLGSLAAASIRNTELLGVFASIERITGFSTDLRSQVANVHRSMRLPHAGTTKQVPYEQLYVPARLSIPKLKKDSSNYQIDDVSRLDGSEGIGSIHVVLENCLRVVVLGDPGGGKSTLARNLAYVTAHDPLQGPKVPFLVELRDFAKQMQHGDKRTLISYLEGLCRSPYNIEPPADTVEYLLLNDRAIVIFDGLDELLDTSLRRDVVEVVQSFAHRFPTCPILVTSRKVGYEEAPLDPDLFWIVQLGEFQHSDVAEYVSKWFQLDESMQVHLKTQLAESFMVDSDFVSDLRMNPLLLSLMCGIYASENYIPRNRPDVYEKCSLMLFDLWDKQRGIKPSLPFDAHVQAAMRSLALHMFTSSADAYLSRDEILQYMKKYLFEKRFDNEQDAENAAIEFLDFCKGRAWVLTEVGAEKYGFTHRTFLEYFSASQLVRLHSSAPSLFDCLKDRIRAQEWDVVAQLALQILGKQVEDGADDFIELALAEYLEIDYPENDGLLSFAVRALHFIVPRPILIQKICSLTLQAAELEIDGRSGTLLARLSQVSVENTPRVGAALRDSISDAITTRKPVLLIAIAAFYLPAMNGSPYSYWIKWVEENLDSYFHSFCKRASRSVWWLAAIQFERGAISFKQLIRMHGLSALYRHDVPRVGGGGPPIAYNLLAAETVGYRNTLGQLTPIGINEQIASQLETVSSARMRYLRQYEASASALDFVRRRPASDVELFLILPLIEVWLRRAPRTRDTDSENFYPTSNPSLILLIEARDRPNGPVRQAFDHFKDLVQENVVLRDALNAWLKQEHSYISG